MRGLVGDNDLLRGTKPPPANTTQQGALHLDGGPLVLPLAALIECLFTSLWGGSNPKAQIMLSETLLFFG